MAKNLTEDKRPDTIEGMDSKGSDLWYHTQEFDMFRNDEETTKSQKEFLISIGYKFPDLSIQDIIDKYKAS